MVVIQIISTLLIIKDNSLKSWQWSTGQYGSPWSHLYPPLPVQGSSKDENIFGHRFVLYCIMRPYTHGRLDRYRIGIPRELSEIRTQP